MPTARSIGQNQAGICGCTSGRPFHHHCASDSAKSTESATHSPGRRRTPNGESTARRRRHDHPGATFAAVVMVG